MIGSQAHKHDGVNACIPQLFFKIGTCTRQLEIRIINNGLEIDTNEGGINILRDVRFSVLRGCIGFQRVPRSTRAQRRVLLRRCVLNVKHRAVLISPMRENSSDIFLQGLVIAVPSPMGLLIKPFLHVDDDECHR